MKRAALVGVLALAASGCMIGPRIGSYAPAAAPQGAAVIVDDNIRTELLTASDTALLLRRPNGRLVLEHFGAFGAWDIELPEGRRTFSMAFRAPSRSELERFRLVSRYPQGLTPAQLEALLSDAGQKALEVK